jgi:phage terminase large subunit-like protein
VSTESLIRRLQSATVDERRAFLASLADDPRKLIALKYAWRAWARPSQLAPEGDWFVLLAMCGRGWGKTRAAAEWIQERVMLGKAGRIALVSKDPADARKVMVEGQSGLLRIARPDWRPKYYPSRKELHWKNGAIATIYSGEDPDALRGPEHDTAWGDEFAAWKYLQDTLDNLLMGLRIKGPRGNDPQAFVTTTPKPHRALIELKNSPGTIVVGGSTYENKANLAAAFMRKIVSSYEGTRIGRQELYAEILEEVEGAFWTRELLEANRVRTHPELSLVVVGVDPMAREQESRRKVAPPETGIVVAGVDSPGEESHFYTLADYSVPNAQPEVWAERAIAAYHDFKADYIVAEVNNGGDMVRDVITTRDPNIKVKMVTATRGKKTRASPISHLMALGRDHHVGFLGDLETQLCTWSGAKNEPSPDRLDAKVWAITELRGSGFAVPDAIDMDIFR